MIPGKVTVEPSPHDKNNFYTTTNNHLRNNFATGLFKHQCFKQQHTSLFHQRNKNLGTFYKTSFISCLSGFKSAILPCSVGKTNVASLVIFSNVVHAATHPAMIGFIYCPRETTPHRMTNIEYTGMYTNHYI
ncbi:hypothetical protein [Ferruginibacter sp.]|uniref:hypothetical protein n=2 Tax=Ferruginibacter sp. TaxID=1940288 RepID=UPI002659F7A5|nr:hypothetical protein [Ferruginibacter sp.]